MRAIQKYEEREVPFAAWILRVARNAALDHVRSRRQIPVEEVWISEDGHEQTSFEYTHALKAALADLPESQREVLVLRHIGGLSPNEIAERLGKTEASIQGLHHRGRAALKVSLRELGVAPVTAVARRPSRDPRDSERGLALGAGAPRRSARPPGRRRGRRGRAAQRARTGARAQVPGARPPARVAAGTRRPARAPGCGFPAVSRSTAGWPKRGTHGRRALGGELRLVVAASQRHEPVELEALRTRLLLERAPAELVEGDRDLQPHGHARTLSHFRPGPDRDESKSVTEWGSLTPRVGRRAELVGFWALHHITRPTLGAPAVSRPSCDRYETATGTNLTRSKLHPFERLRVHAAVLRLIPATRPSPAGVSGSSTLTAPLLALGDEVGSDPADPESAPALGIEDHGGRFTARRDAELAEGRGQMALDGALGEEQLGRDLGVGQPR